jgi:hypothetical protein
MNKDWKLAAGTVAVAAALAVPASATASLARPAVAAGALPACFQTTPGNSDVTVPLSLTGGGPGDDFDVDGTEPTFANDDDGSASGVFDTSGNASVGVTGVFVPGDPIDPTAGRPVALTVNDYSPDTDTPTATTVATVMVSEGGLNVDFNNGGALKKHPIQVADTAFAGKPIYGFVTNSKGKLERRFALGKGDPTCGYAKGSAVVAPAKIITGTYYLYLNAGSKLNKRAAVSEKFRLYRF